MPIGPEHPSRRVRRVERTFRATTGELQAVVEALDTRRRQIAADLEADAKKPKAGRMGEDDRRIMTAQAEDLARIVEELTRQTG